MFVHITPTVMDGIVVRWNPDADRDAEISASRHGVLVSGWPLIRYDRQRAQFTNVLALAWEMSRMLDDGITAAEAQAWLVGRNQRIIEVRFGETLADALKRENAISSHATTEGE